MALDFQASIWATKRRTTPAIATFRPLTRARPGPRLDLFIIRNHSNNNKSRLSSKAGHPDSEARITTIHRKHNNVTKVDPIEHLFRLKGRNAFSRAKAAFFIFLSARVLPITG